MVRPRKVPRNFIPQELSDTEDEELPEIPLPVLNQVPVPVPHPVPELIDGAPGANLNTSSESSHEDTDTTDTDTTEATSEIWSNFAREWLLLEMKHCFKRSE